MERQAEARIRMVNIPSDPGTEEFQSALLKEQQEMNRKLSDVYSLMQRMLIENNNPVGHSTRNCSNPTIPPQPAAETINRGY
jgi:hypothetical protein